MLRIYTLGPTGTCHENALRHYLRFQNVPEAEAEIILVDDLVAAGQKAVDDGDAYLLQCSAHHQVHIVTERYRERLPVVDTFIFPTQPLALLKRRDVEHPRQLALPEPTLGYINVDDWDEVIFETSKPVVAAKLLAGEYDAGLAYTFVATENPDRIELLETFGEVVTTWLLYGPRARYRGEIIAMPYPELNAPQHVS